MSSSIPFKHKARQMLRNVSSEERREQTKYIGE